MRMLNNHVCCFQHGNTTSRSVALKDGGQTVVFGQYPFYHVLITSGTPVYTCPYYYYYQIYQL